MDFMEGQAPISVCPVEHQHSWCISLDACESNFESTASNYVSAQQTGCPRCLVRSNEDISQLLALASLLLFLRGLDSYRLVFALSQRLLPTQPRSCSLPFPGRPSLEAAPEFQDLHADLQAGLLAWSKSVRTVSYTNCSSSIVQYGIRSLTRGQ